MKISQALSKYIDQVDKHLTLPVNRKSEAEVGVCRALATQPQVPFEVVAECIEIARQPD